MQLECPAKVMLTYPSLSAFLTPDRSLVRVPDTATKAQAEVQAGMQYNHILACIMDANPFLGEGSKQVGV